MQEKLKSILKDDALFYAAVIVLVGAAAFGLGRASVAMNEEAAPRHTATPAVAAPEKPTEARGTRPSEEGDAAPGAYVASKNSDKYHLPWCSGAQRIKDENKVWFESKEEAESSGYEPAGNCKGI